MEDKKEDESSEKAKFFSSAHSPFPYGSPLQRASQRLTPAQRVAQTSFSGSPGQKLLLGGTFNRGRSSSLNHSHGQMNGDVVSVTPRLKGQDLYGGPVMFGSSARRSRLLSSTPYSAAMSLRMKERKKSRSVSGAPSSETSLAASGTSAWNNSTQLTGTTKGNLASQKERMTPDPPVDGMSSTARLILETLDKMSTPIQDALKMPVPRAEKRKLVEEELNCSLGSPGRRRPRLGGGPEFGRSSLGGPPLRKNYSPLPVRASPSSPSSSSSTAGAKKLPPPSAALERAPSPILPPVVAPPAPPSVATATHLPPSVGAAQATKILPMISSTPLKPFSPAGSFPTSSAAATAATPLSSIAGAGGKFKTTKFSEGLRESKAKKIEEEEAPEIPAFLTGKVPVLQAPATMRLDPLPSPVLSTKETEDTGFFGSLAKKKSTEATNKAEQPPSSAPFFGLSKPFEPISKVKDSAQDKPSEQISKPIMFSFQPPVDASTTKSAKGSSPPPPAAAPGATAAVKDTDLKTAAWSSSVGAVAAEPSKSKTSRKYKFNPPRVVSTKKLVGGGGGGGGSAAAGTSYTFCAPTMVRQSAASGTPTTTTVLPAAVNDVQTTVVNFKSAAMPDVTNNVKRKGVDVIQDTGKGGLPDITASTVFGFGPASNLKKGSVMDILGKK